MQKYYVLHINQLVDPFHSVERFFLKLSISCAVQMLCVLSQDRVTYGSSSLMTTKGKDWKKIPNDMSSFLPIVFKVLHGMFL